MKSINSIVALVITVVCSLAGNKLFAEDAVNTVTRTGFKVRFGGRYDNVRMCVASKAGFKGGIAADLSAFAEIPVFKGALLHIDLPVMRPILFAAAFHMLQFEPTCALVFSNPSAQNHKWVVGPALGVSLHYGPDYNSESSGAGRTPSFFALGPIIGGYAGRDFIRPNKAFDVQIGFSPYITPLFSVHDPENHRGVVIGALVDAAFRLRQYNTGVY